MLNCLTPHIPEYVKNLECFGVGKFTPEEVEEKIQAIAQALEARETPDEIFISVVIPAHKEEEGILATMLSLANQTYKNVEFIFVVNGEEPGSPTEMMIRRAGFKVIYEKEGNIPKARQIGAEQAQGRFIVNTDADTLHETNWLETWVEVIQREGLIRGASTTRSLSPNLLPNIFIESYALSYRIKRLLRNVAFTGIDEANSVVEREALMNAGGWNPNVRLGEGYELFNRLPQDGHTPYVYFDDGLRAYTSGRRFEEQNPLQLFWTLTRQAVSRMLGKEPKITADHYGDYR